VIFLNINNHHVSVHVEIAIDALYEHRRPEEIAPSFAEN